MPSDPTGWPDEAREAVAKAIYQRHHKGIRNVWHWDNAGLDIEHPGVRDVYLAQADAAFAALAPFLAAALAQARRETWVKAARVAALEGVTASGQAEETESDNPSMPYHEGRADAAASIVAAIRAKAREAAP
jgi:hypothetical protein